MNNRTINQIIKTCNNIRTVAQEDILQNEAIIDKRIEDSTYNQGRIDMCNIIMQDIHDCEKETEIESDELKYICICARDCTQIKCFHQYPHKKVLACDTHCPFCYKKQCIPYTGD